MKHLLEVRVPKNLLGVIVGYRGSNVKFLSERYNVDIYVPPKHEGHGSVKVIEIRGSNSSATDCARHVNEILRQVEE